MLAARSSSETLTVVLRSGVGRSGAVLPVGRSDVRRTSVTPRPGAGRLDPRSGPRAGAIAPAELERAGARTSDLPAFFSGPVDRGPTLGGGCRGAMRSASPPREAGPREALGAGPLPDFAGGGGGIAGLPGFAGGGGAVLLAFDGFDAIGRPSVEARTAPRASAGAALPFEGAGGGGVFPFEGPGPADFVAAFGSLGFAFPAAGLAGITRRGGGICGNRDFRCPFGSPRVGFSAAAAFLACFSRRPRFASARFATGFSLGPGRNTLGFLDADSCFAGFFSAPFPFDGGAGFFAGRAAWDFALGFAGLAFTARVVEPFFAPDFVLFPAMRSIAAPSKRVPPTHESHQRGGFPAGNCAGPTSPRSHFPDRWRTLLRAHLIRLSLFWAHLGRSGGTTPPRSSGRAGRVG